MLYFDLAELYQTETKVFNQSVKRNIKRFPDDFMFRLTNVEWLTMRSQSVTASNKSSIIVLSETQNKRNTVITLFAFTEQGVAMLRGILNSDIAINMIIAIMRTFIEMRKVVEQPLDLKEIKERLGEHDIQLNQIYDAIENILDEKAAERKWNDRNRIGFN